ncbi:MAG: DUF5686 and carboxypeptidase regulatory-like domain-containing protein [Ginsengibacter sp.]
MNQRFLLFIFLLGGYVANSQSFKVYGIITNTRLEPLAFASVQVKDRTEGIVTKENGSYELLLDDGVYDLVISMVGYKSQVIQVVINKADHLQNVILETSDSKSLDEVIIKGKKDRSEEVIRQVIRNRESIQAAAGSWSATVYIKAVQDDSSAAARKKKKPLRDTAKNANADLLRMAMAEISLRYEHSIDGRTKEERTGVTKKGKAENLFFLSSTEGNFDFYNNLIAVPSISVTPFLSPVSYSGLIAYRYKMLKTEQQGTHKIYTISVKPGKLSNATVEGEITITDSGWAILHTRFSFPKYHLASYDFFEVEQQYDVINRKAWMITRQQFTYYSKTNKSKVSGTTIVTYRDFELNKTFEKKYFGPEISRVSDSAYKRDSSFWQQVRTEPLTKQEVRFIHYKDSIYNATHTKAYLDSIDYRANKVTWKKILFFGQPMYNREKERLWTFNPLYTYYQPLQFGGTRINPSVSFSKTYPSRKNIFLYANLSYGLRNKDLNGNIRFSKMYNPFNHGFYGIELHRDFQYIFPGDAWINLLKRSNLYLDNSLDLRHGLEITNGLFVTTTISFALRRSIAGYKQALIDTLFNSIAGDNEAVNFHPYNATYGNIEVSYTPHQKYIREPKEKIILGSAWPTFYTVWKKGIPGFMNSQVNFDYLEMGMRQSIKLGLLGVSSYTILTGSFLNTKDLRLVDYKFERRGDPIFFLNPAAAFQSLDSTFPVFKRFYEGHYLHEFNGAILNKIPLFKKLQLREIAGAGFLVAPERNLRYAEIFTGIERVFKAPFNLPTKFKLGVYGVSAVANRFSNPIQFKIGITTWDRAKGKWF